MAQPPGEQHAALARIVDVFGLPESRFAGGSAAAATGAIAASIAMRIARESGLPAVAAQASALAQRLLALAASNASAYSDAREALETRGAGDDERADYRLGAALSAAADIPLQISEACADVAMLAQELSQSAKVPLLPDATAAASLAVAGSRAAATIVEANLVVVPEDGRAARARAAASAAGAGAD